MSTPKSKPLGLTVTAKAKSKVGFGAVQLFLNEIVKTLNTVIHDHPSQWGENVIDFPVPGVPRTMANTQQAKEKMDAFVCARLIEQLEEPPAKFNVAVTELDAMGEHPFRLHISWVAEVDEEEVQNAVKVIKKRLRNPSGPSSGPAAPRASRKQPSQSTRQ